MAKKKRPNYARTTISIPRPLKKRMKEAQHHVNWSAVACQAFRAKLDELEEVAEPQNIQQVVQRLRRQQRAGAELSAGGRDQGRRWAMSRATLDELRRLEAFRVRHEDDAWRALLLGEDGWRELARQIEGEGPRGIGKDKRFWKRAISVAPEGEAFFLEFADAALDVWREVKERL